jgi:hypothetical protein
MDQVLPGLLHWTTYHEGIGATVHSHLHVPSGAVFDPRLPEGGTAALAQAAVPSVVLLSNRHHLRHGAEFAAAYGCPIRCHRAGLHAFGGPGAPDVEPFDFGEEVAPGVTALELGILTPEETVFRIATEPAALLFADAVVRHDGRLAFVPDQLLGDDPEEIRRGLRARLAQIAEAEDFDVLLFAHGEPMPAGGKQALAEFAAAG